MLTNFFNKQRPLKYNEETRVVHQYILLLNTAVLSNSAWCKFTSIPAYAVKTRTGCRPLMLLVASLRAAWMRAFAPRAGGQPRVARSGKGGGGGSAVASELLYQRGEARAMLYAALL